MTIASQEKSSISWRRPAPTADRRSDEGRCAETKAGGEIIGFSTSASSSHTAPTAFAPGACDVVRAGEIAWWRGDAIRVTLASSRDAAVQPFIAIGLAGKPTTDLDDAALIGCIGWAAPGIRISTPQGTAFSSKTAQRLFAGDKLVPEKSHRFIVGPIISASKSKPHDLKDMIVHMREGDSVQNDFCWSILAGRPLSQSASLIYNVIRKMDVRRPKSGDILLICGGPYHRITDPVWSLELGFHHPLNSAARLHMFEHRDVLIDFSASPSIGGEIPLARNVVTTDRKQRLCDMHPPCDQG